MKKKKKKKTVIFDKTQGSIATQLGRNSDANCTILSPRNHPILWEGEKQKFHSIAQITFSDETSFHQGTEPRFPASTVSSYPNDNGSLGQLLASTGKQGRIEDRVALSRAVCKSHNDAFSIA